VVGSLDRLGNVALVSAAIVAATRILAHVREKTAHELAKAVPLSLAILLLTGATLNLERNLKAILERPERSDLTAGLVIFLIALEIGLRLMTDGSRALLAAVRRRRGIEGDLSVWRSLRVTIRRRLSLGSGGAEAGDMKAAPPP
jgi:hypothetical protein